MEISALDLEIIKFEEWVKYAKERAYDIIHSTQNNIKYINGAISVNLQQKPLKFDSLLGHFEIAQGTGVSFKFNQLMIWDHHMKVHGSFHQAWFFHVEQRSSYGPLDMVQNVHKCLKILDSIPQQSPFFYYNFCYILKNGQTQWFSPQVFPISRLVMGFYICHKTVKCF